MTLDIELVFVRRNTRQMVVLPVTADDWHFPGVVMLVLPVTWVTFRTVVFSNENVDERAKQGSPCALARVARNVTP